MFPVKLRTPGRRRFTSLKYLTVISRHKHLCTKPIPNSYFKSPTHQTLHQDLEKCSSMRQIMPLHAQIILHGLAHKTLTLGKLISFCAVSACGDLCYAHQVFDEIPEPNRYMYNSLIRGYSTSDDPARAFFMYRDMTCSGICPNEFTFPFVLKACTSISAYLEGVSVHVQVIKLGFGCQVVVQNALVGFYFGCGSIGCARKMFNEIADRTLVSWNSMISAYSKTGGYEDAFLLFWEMRGLGVEPDDFTFVSLLSVCSQKCDVKLGSLLHSYIQITGIKVDIYVQNALLDMYASFGHLHTAQAVFDRITEKNVVSWTSMVSAYAKSGLIEPAKKLFDQTPLKNVVCYNSMIACYVQEGCFKEAMDLFRDLCKLKLVPDEITLVSVLSACCQLDDLDMGKKIHDYIRSDIMTPSITLCNALIDMYAKCGSVETALGVFLEMREKNMVSWNVMIGGLALHGCGSKAVELFENMTAGRLCPDQITFTGLLSACCHSGLVDVGRYYFDRMSTIHRVPRQVEHYACMIDLLARGGLFGEAIKLIGAMPMRPDAIVWGALLGACRIHGNIEVGKQILKQVLELEPHSGGLYVLISNMYSEAQRWKDVKNIRKLMEDHGIKKDRAISFIEVEVRVHKKNG